MHRAASLVFAAQDVLRRCASSLLRMGMAFQGTPPVQDRLDSWHSSCREQLGICLCLHGVVAMVGSPWLCAWKKRMASPWP